MTVRSARDAWRNAWRDALPLLDAWRNAWRDALPLLAQALYLAAALWAIWALRG